MIIMHMSHVKTLHHCDKVLFEQLALEETIWRDFGSLVASSVWYVMP